MSFLQQLGDVLGSSVTRAAGNVSVRIKTNLGPPLTVSNLTAPGPSILDALGVKYAVTVLDAKGNTIVASGSEPPTNPIIVAAYLGFFFGVSFIMYRGVRSFFK